MKPFKVPMRLSSFLLLLFLFSFKGIDHTNWPSYPVELSKDLPNNLENEIFTLINQHRQSMGLALLQLNNIESSEAGKHSRDMASGRLPFGHDGFKSRINFIAKQLGFISASAENVAYGTMTAKEVVDTWLQSPEHRKNIEGNYAITGIGTAKDKNGVMYYTEIFIR